MSIDPKQHSKDRFGRFAERYVQSKTHSSDNDLQRLVAIAEPQPDWEMLDIATGGGHTARTFAPLVKHVVASDLTPAMLEAARNSITAQGITNVEFQQADAEQLPFEDNRFDLVTCRIAPHHFPNVDRFVAEVARVLKAEAVFVLQDQVAAEDSAVDAYMNDFEKLRDPSHNRALRVSEWEQHITAMGMAVEHSEPFTKRHHLLAWARIQDNTEATIAELQRRLQDASPDAKAWMLPENAGTDDATFANRHILLRARKQR